MGRFPHYIKGNKGNQTPTHVILFDTETRSEKVDSNTIEATLSLGWYAYIRRLKGGKWSQPSWQRFTTPDAFWASVSGLCRPKRRVYLISHNLAFDLTVSKGFGWLHDNGWQNTSRILGRKILSLTYRQAGRHMVLMDSLNIFPMPLSDLGEWLGLPKLPMPLESAPDAEWDTYCRNDVTILIEAFKSWWDLLQAEDLGNFSQTLASQAMNAYRHRFMPTPIFIDTNEGAQELGRSAYMGGRTEAFFLGRVEGDSYCLDVNSMYAYIMATQEAPYRLVSSYTRATPDDLTAWLAEYALTAEVEIDTPDPVYPWRYDNRTMYPVGRFITWLATPELAHALDQGHVIKVRKCYIYERSLLFADYVSHFWALRATALASGDGTTAAMAKLFLNNLYGKFGQKGQIWVKSYETESMDVRYWDEWDVEEQKASQYRQFAGMVEEYQDVTESRESFPAIAAHITSGARLYLWQLINQAGRENIYYCDTDSMIVNKDGYDNLSHIIDATKLGHLKLEWASDDLVINGLKDYTVDGHIVAKGIRKSATEISPGVYRQVEFKGLQGMLRSGDLGHQLITQVEKSLAREYQKGVVEASGRVIPHRLPR